ncbi:helix-turn-helix domain-containing protein [Streptococcus suis]|uniref:helix-turn-helix domain-containing protein n=1 Tax=Streptococcus suis TaxID=1307 RepID=UPI000CF4E463|nr:S24 family peptidase [Streptococcus suis]
MDKKIIIGQRLRELRLKHNLEQIEVAQKLGYKSDTTISKWENGKNLPTGKKLILLAQLFNTTTDEILLGETTPTTAPNSLIEQISDKVVQLHQDRQKNVLSYATEQLDEQERGRIISDKVIDLYDARKRISLPVPGKVSAGTGYWQEDDYDTMVSFYADDIPDQKDFDTIAIAVGHSMEPKIKNGDFLFIKFTPTVDLNKIGIFQVDGENYVKKLKSDYLESLNPDYDNVQFTENMRTIGEVVDIYRGIVR